MISVIIPALNEKHLNKTVENVLENSVGDIEIIVVLDGYWPNPSLKDHPNVVVIHHTEPRGQRPSINEAARIAKGNIIMKLDAHCAVAPGFNQIIERDLEYDMTMIPTMYNLDIDTFQPKKHKRTDYMYISSMQAEQPFRAQYYSGKHRAPKSSKQIDETMCCMGPCFVMMKDRFWELGGCDEAHGHWGQQGVEVSLKAWLSGGRLVVNKNTWFAHWFRGSYVHDTGRKGFPYSIKQRQIDAARAYSQDLWLNNKWPKQTRTIEWLVEKFNPPTWELSKLKEEKLYTIPKEEHQELNKKFYQHIHRVRNHPIWKGIPILKMPSDLLIYSEAIQETTPEIIVEIGTKFGGSALYLKDMLSLNLGGGEVITVDIKDQVKYKDPSITYLTGNSLDAAMVDKIKELTKDKRTMLIIDGNHSRKHVKWELSKYWKIVSPGCYMVVEDCYIDRGLYGPGEARDWFLEKTSAGKLFEQTDKTDKFVIGVTRGGWLLRK